MVSSTHSTIESLNKDISSTLDNITDSASAIKDHIAEEKNTLKELEVLLMNTPEE